MNFSFGRSSQVAALLLGLWLWASGAQAQVPTWVLATSGTTSLQLTYSSVVDMAPDANGNLFVTGTFTGQMHLGSFTLTSKGITDWFVAKYVPATNTWAWALRGGGTQDDTPGGLAVSGQNVYVVGTINNTLADAAGVTFGGTNSGPGSVAQAGAGTVLPGYDIALLKLVDQGTTATVGWTQVAGGNSYDWGYGVAASGTSIYITGSLSNSTTNSQNAVFGGSGTTPGTSPQYGTSVLGNNPDLVVAKYTDQGTSALFRWAQVGGSDGIDQGASVAVSGGSVYVTGYVTATNYPAGYVRFGGTGTSLGALTLAGASATYSNDLIVAKYNDLGGSATTGWVQVAGGTGPDQGQRVAVSGSQVYITGQLVNNQANANQVRFGGTGITAGTYVQTGVSPATSPDLLLAKYLDQGTTAAVAWTQVGGGNGADKGYGLLVSNNRVYVSGTIENDVTNSYGVLFGGAGTVPGTLPVPGASTWVGYDLVVAGYLDAGATAQASWQQVGGGATSDFGCQVVLAGTRLYVAGQTATPASYGSLTVTTPLRSTTCLLAALDLPALLATTPAATSPTPHLYPNPAHGPATLGGVTAGAAVGVFDALGRRVATTIADARGTAALPGGLRPGVYVVRAGTGTVRWVIE